MSAVLEKVEKRAVVLNPQRRALAEQWRQEWVVNAEEGTSIEDVMEPAYWAHVSADMEQFDRVEVRMETGEWTADMIVTGVGRNWATVHLIQKHDLAAPSLSLINAASSHEVVWRGAQHKWGVRRLSDKEVIQSGFADKGTAQAWLNDHERKIQTT